MTRSYIRGLGFYVPPKVVTNEDLSRLMDTSDAWIRERTGIQTRHFVEKGVAASDLALAATKNALKDAGLTAKEIEFIILATLSADYQFPGASAILQAKLGISAGGETSPLKGGGDSIGAMDIRTQCSGFVYGLATADAMIRAGLYKRILLVGAEVQSTALDLTTRGRDVAVIFGDGAGAALLEATQEDRGIISSHLHCDGRYAKELWVEHPGSSSHPSVDVKMIEEGRHFPRMNGREVFKFAVTKFVEVIGEALKANRFQSTDIDLLIVHQANIRIAEAVREYLKLPSEKMYNNIDKYGNTTAASIPIALTEAKQLGLLKPGALVCLAAFGSGFTWGATLIRW